MAQKRKRETEVQYEYADESGKWIPDDVAQQLKQVVKTQEHIFLMTHDLKTNSGSINVDGNFTCRLWVPCEGNENKFIQCDFELKKKKQRLIRALVDPTVIKWRNQAYASRYPATKLLTRIQTQMEVREEVSLTADHNVLLLSYHQGRIYLRACLEKIDETERDTFESQVEIWGAFAKARNLMSSVKFVPFWVNQRRMLLDHEKPKYPQAWDSSLFLSFHGTDKKSALNILQTGINFHFSEGRSYGCGFYVTDDINKAMGYAKGEASERAIVVLLTHKGLHHSMMDNWSSSSSSFQSRRADHSSETLFRKEERDRIKKSSQMFCIPKENYFVVRDKDVIFPLVALVY